MDFSSTANQFQWEKKTFIHHLFYNIHFISVKESAINDDDEDSSSSSSSSNYQSITPALVSPKATNRRKRVAVSIASSFNDNISDDGMIFLFISISKCEDHFNNTKSWKTGSYVPGLDFDPKNRSFSQEELRPQPMSKKSKKQVNCTHFCKLYLMQWLNYIWITWM